MIRGTAKHRFAEPKEHYQDDDVTSTHTMRTHDERPPNERPDEYMNERNSGNRKPLRKETENGTIPNARSQQRERKDRTGKKIRFRMTRSKTNSE
jgi:hypothetical protein